VSFYEDAVSHIYTKLTENNVNKNDHSQYDVCFDQRETFENNIDNKTDKISFIEALQAKIFKNKTEENEEYIVAAQNREEQVNYKYKNSTNKINMVQSDKINSIFNENNELKVMKNNSRGNLFSKCLKFFSLLNNLFKLFYLKL